MSALPAFAACGIELEYMIVDSAGLAVRPVADALLRDANGGLDAADVIRGAASWSNEFVAHVIELKGTQPTPDLRRLAAAFEAEIAWMNRLADAHGAKLMPTAMHPWMDPLHETRMWPHDPARIYASFDRIFDCRTHGWANLQSMHVNLPFDGDAQFVRLHDAMRLVLPVLPALAASSPVAQGRPTGWMDWRLVAYRDNAMQFPSITGDVVPEPVDGRTDYEARILAPMYREIAPFDPDRVLSHEWLNSRGAIARFDRSAIEIRVLDMQECPRADLAVAAATCALVRALFDARWQDAAAQRLPTVRLVRLLEICMRDAEQAIIDDAEYLACLGYRGVRCEARELWAHLVEALSEGVCANADMPIGNNIAADWRAPLDHILRQGPLARRLQRAAGAEPSHARLVELAQALCECLAHGRMFDGC